MASQSGRLPTVVSHAARIALSASGCHEVRIQFSCDLKRKNWRARSACHHASPNGVGDFEKGKECLLLQLGEAKPLRALDLSRCGIETRRTHIPEVLKA
jgi:hypothetical protein